MSNAGLAAMAERFDQAAEHVEVVRRFWDGRADVAGRWYAARGRAVTAHPPQVVPPKPPSVTAAAWPCYLTHPNISGPPSGPRST